jgi:hypothetical protein
MATPTESIRGGRRPSKSKPAALNHFQNLKKRSSKYMSYLRKVAAIALLAAIAASVASAQCGDKAGFAKQLCQFQANARENATASAVTGASDSVMNAVKKAPLTTSLSDAIHLGTLPPSIDPKEFAPLLKLERTDNGAFILKTGVYEAVFESYTLAFYDDHAPRGSAFFPAPIKGSRAKVIAEILKYAELHPDVPQPLIQNLLSYTVYGTDLQKMPPQVQQAAQKLLPKETLAKMRAGVQTKVGNKIIILFGRQLGKDAKTATDITGAIATAKAIDQTYGVTGTLKDMKAVPATLAAGSTEHGTWAQMEGGYYVRYLNEGIVRTRLQVIVPEAAMEHVDPKKPLTFDPTQYVAVHAGTPAQILGMTLRPAGGK